MYMPRKPIFPSEKLSVEEELKPGEGTHIDNHEVRSSVFGYPQYNRDRYRVSVKSVNNRRVKPKRYDDVIGNVIMVSKSSVKININYLNSRPVIPSISAIMHISDASRNYIQDIDEAYASGDIVKATIIDSRSIPLQLECKKNDTGVIYSTCDLCGEEVSKIKRDSLQCIVCSHKQSRKTAINYGNVTLIPDY